MFVLFATLAFAIEPLDPVSEEDIGIDSLMVVAPPADLGDVPLRVVGKVGTRPVVVNPKNANRVVAAFVTETGCYTRASANGGQSWAPAKKLPLAADMKICDAPTLLWSTDGRRVYAAFFYRRNNASGLMVSGGIALSFSSNHGVTWSPPVRVIDIPDVNEPPTYGEFNYEKIFLAMPLPEHQANTLYLLGEIHPQLGVGYDFFRSSNRGLTWTPRKFLTGYDAPGGDYGEAIAAGLGGRILVTVGHIEDSTKQVVALRSSDYGETFTRSVIVANVETVDTAVAFGVNGAAHLVYVESGDAPPSRIRYTRSLRPPYTSWSAPVTLGSDIHNGEQRVGMPALAVSPCGSAGSVLQVVWLSNWEGFANFNVYYTRKFAGNPWSDSLRVSDYTLAQGDRAEPGLAAAAGKAIAVWGTEAPSSDPFAVWSSRIAPGIPCP